MNRRLPDPNDAQRPRAPDPTRRTLPHIARDAPATIFEWLLCKYDKVPRETWARRCAEGLVYTARGPVTPDTPYEPGLELCYHREGWRPEPAVNTDWMLIHEDDDLLVVDKPHGLPVMPSGRYITRTLMTLLRDATGNRELVPLHRLDRDTAGLVCFSKRPETRGTLGALFVPGAIRKEYLARCEIRGELPASPFTVRGRIEVEIPYWKRRLVVDGAPDSETEFELLSSAGGAAEAIARPRTGKTHQIRVHLASVGLPILGDRTYRDGLPPDPEAALAEPLQLLCRSLELVQPISGERLLLQSRRRLGG